MDNFIKWFKEVMYFTLPGFIYLISIFIFFNDLINYYITIDLDVLFKSHLLIIVVIILISYIIGLSLQYALQGIIWCLFPRFFNEYLKSIKENITEKERKEVLKIIYDTMIMYRHLVISIIFLFVSLIRYKLNTNLCSLLLIFGLLIAILLLAYFLYLRKAYLANKKCI